MKCSDFKKCMTDFINDTLDDKKLEEFISHYKKCQACREELEIYYMINKTFNDEFSEGHTVGMTNSFNFKKRLNLRITRCEARIRNRHKVKILLGTALICTEILALGMAVLYFLEKFY